MERWADRIAGTSPAKRPTRTATIVPTRTPTPRPPRPSDPGRLIIPKLKVSAPIVVAPLVKGQWDFDQGDLRATLGTDMQYGDLTGETAMRDHTSFGTTTSFGIPDIGVRRTAMGAVLYSASFTSSGTAITGSLATAASSIARRFG